MNVRTSRNLMLAAAVVCMLNFTSCSKYEDGPAFSLKMKTSRLTGEWLLIEVDGEEIEDVEMTFEFERNGSFTMAVQGEYEFGYGSYTYTYDIDIKEKGDWEWIDDKEGVELDYDDSDMGKEEFEILRLTNKELWVEDESGDEIIMEKQ